MCFILKHQSVEDECKQITEKDAFITFFPHCLEREKNRSNSTENSKDETVSFSSLRACDGPLIPRLVSGGAVLPSGARAATLPGSGPGFRAPGLRRDVVVGGTEHSTDPSWAGAGSPEPEEWTGGAACHARGRGWRGPGRPPAVSVLFPLKTKLKRHAFEGRATYGRGKPLGSKRCGGFRCMWEEKPSGGRGTHRLARLS